MKLFSPASFLVGGITLATCCCGGPSSKSSIAYAAESSRAEAVEKTYTVEGMFCGGCKMNVEAALKRVQGVEEVKAKIIDADRKLGEATVKIRKDQNKGHETDCKIAKQIHDDTGYTAYLKGVGRNSCAM